MACDHYKDCKLHIYWKQLEYDMPVKRDKKNSFFTSSEGGFYNNWVGHSVMKLVDAELFQRIKDVKGVNKERKKTSVCKLYKKVLYIRH